METSFQLRSFSLYQRLWLYAQSLDWSAGGGDEKREGRNDRVSFHKGSGSNPHSLGTNGVDIHMTVENIVRGGGGAEGEKREHN